MKAPGMGPDRPRLSISVLQLNGWPLTQRCLESLCASAAVPTEILVWDNGSQDGSADHLKAWHAAGQFGPKITGVRLTMEPVNRGFIEPHNAQVGQAAGEYVAILNNDVVVAPGWDLELLAPFRTTHQLGAVGVRWHYGFLDAAMCGGPGPASQEVEYLEGFCMVMPTALARQYGPFDAAALVWATGEDADLCLRLRQGGWQITALRTDTVQHVGRATMDRVSDEALGYNPAENERRNRDILTTRWARYLQTRRMEPRRILVRRSSSFGDVLCVEPILRGLRQKYPGAQLTMLTTAYHAPAIAHSPHVDRMTDDVGELRRDYDDVIDLDDAYEQRPQMHLVDAYAHVAHVPADRPRWYLNAEGHRMADSMPHDRPLCVVALEVTWPMREWPIERFAEVAAHLARGYQLVQVGSQASKRVGLGIDLCGKTTLQQLAGVFSRASLVVTVDSLAVHLAGCFAVPTIGLWGGTDPRYRVHGPEHRAVQRDDWPCRGCHHDRPAPRHHTDCDRGQFRGLAIPMNACMDIPVSAVMKALSPFMEG